MNGVEAQGVDVKIGEPMESILNEEAPDRFAVSAIEIDGLTPRRAVAIGEIRTKIIEVIALRAEVVVDDVESHGHSQFVAGVDEALEPVPAAVGVLNRKWIDAVIAPVALAGKLSERHEFDGSDAERLESG